MGSPSGISGKVVVGWLLGTILAVGVVIGVILWANGWHFARGILTPPQSATSAPVQAGL